MDNVLNIEKCKICGGVISIENTSENLAKVCTCCGYFYYKDKEEDSVKVEYLNPCGAYKLITLSGVGQVGTLGENISEEDILKKFNFTDTSRLDMNKTYINYRDTITQEFKIIFGNGKPESYEEYLGTIK